LHLAVRRNLLKVPSEVLAQAIAFEWDIQNEFIEGDRMPLVSRTLFPLSYRCAAALLSAKIVCAELPTAVLWRVLWRVMLRVDRQT
jgi:hypothetical protein